MVSLLVLIMASLEFLAQKNCWTEKTVHLAITFRKIRLDILFVLFFCYFFIALPFAVLNFLQVIIVLIQVYNWEIRHHSMVCHCALADILQHGCEAWVRKCIQATCTHLSRVYEINQRMLNKDLTPLNTESFTSPPKSSKRKKGSSGMVTAWTVGRSQDQARGVASFSTSQLTFIFTYPESCTQVGTDLTNTLSS